MNFKEQILSRTGTPQSASTDSDITYYLNSTIKDVINKVKAVNPDAYSRMAIQTEVSSEGSNIIDGDIIAVYGTSVHEGTQVTSINIVNSGANYTDSGGQQSTHVTVSITGGGGSGATAYAIVSGSGLISDIILTNGGSGYTSTPNVSITTTDIGSNAEATATLNSAATYRRPATEVSFDLSEQAKNPNSIHYQSKFNPVWVRNGRSISIIPEGGMVLHIDIPTTTYDSSDIPSIPKTFENAVVLGSSITHAQKYLQHLTHNEIPLYVDVSIPTPPTFTVSLPSQITAPTFTWNPTLINSKFDGQEIDTSNIRNNFPSYVAPVLDIPTLEALNDISMPDPPSVPSFITQSISLDSIPVFSAPALQIEEFPTIPEFNTATTIPSPPIAPNLTAIDISETSLEELPSPPVFVPPKILGQAKSLLEDAVGGTIAPAEASAQNISTLIEAAWSYVVELEDVELTNATLSVISNIQGLYGTAMQEADKHYQQQVGEYTAVISRQLEKARLEQTSEHKQNDMDWQAKITQYDKELAQHQAEMSRYQANVSTEISQWTLKYLTHQVAVWSQKQDKYFTEFDKAMQSSMNSFQSDMASWDKDFQLKSKELELEDKAQASLVAQFQNDMASYQASVKKVSDEYQQNELLKKWEKYKFEYTQSLSKFSAEMQSNLNIFNEQNTKLTTEIQIAQANASNAQSALLSQMQVDTELAKNNESQRLAMDLQTFQQDLAAFNAEMSRYQNEVSTVGNRYQVEMSKATQQIAANQQKYTADFQSFQNRQQGLEKLIGNLRQEYAESIGVMIQQKQGE